MTGLALELVPYHESQAASLEQATSSITGQRNSVHQPVPPPPPRAIQKLMEGPAVS